MEDVLKGDNLCVNLIHESNLCDAQFGCHILILEDALIGFCFAKSYLFDSRPLVFAHLYNLIFSACYLDSQIKRTDAQFGRQCFEAGVL